MIADKMNLQEEIDKIRADIRTDSYSMSIGEWISLYEHNEIDVHPEFQRFFRWTSTQKTLFIESLLLGIPIPPIFISQREDGVWEVIDGLQRLSTIYEFFGILKDEQGSLVEPLVLEATKYLPALKQKRCDDSEHPEFSLTPQQRLYIKRTKLPVSILLKESDKFAKYELFQRLNTGNSPLTPQEVRNAILVQQNRDMYQWLVELAEYDNFRECTPISEKLQEEQYYLELVLRFIVFRTITEDNLKKMNEVGGFLTDHMVALASSPQFDYAAEATAFKQTFDILAQNSRDNSFRRYDPNKQKFVGSVLLAAFEIFGLGIGYHHATLSRHAVNLDELIKKFWCEEHPDLLIPTNKITALKTPKRLLTTIAIGRKLFDL